MQNLLEIQNALRSAPDQQLMALMQGANPTVPQWAVASELNNRKEMRDEQTRQQGLGQPTVLEGLMGAAPASTPQTNVAGMPQGVASGMAQSMAPKTNVNQNTGINTVARNANAAAPVATMASGGILKMQDGGDPAEKTYTFVYPEDMNTPPFELGISDLDEYDAVIKAIRKLGGTIVETDTGRVMQSDTAKEILQESSDVAEADARVPKYVPSASDLYATEAGRFKSENATPENYVVSAGLPPAGGAMYSSPTGARGGSTDSSGLGLPTGEFSQTSLSAIPRPKGLATLGAAGDADMLDETVGVQIAPTTPSSPGIAAGTPFDTTKYTPRLPKKSIKAIQTGVDDKGRGIFIPSLEETQLDDLRGRSGVGAFSKVPFNATSDEAAKESVNQATLANNARDERVARVTSGEPGTELAETVGRIAPKADEPQQLRFIKAILNKNAGEAVSENDAQPEVFATDRVNPFAFNKAPETKKPEVFDALEDIRFQELLVNDSPEDPTVAVDQILIDQVKKLKTPQEQIAAIKLASDKHTIAQKAEVAARKELAEAKKTDTDVYRAEKKLEAAQKETNRIERAAPWVLEGNFGIKRAFGPEISKLVEAQAANDLQAEAAADVAKATTNENYPVSPVEVRKRLRAMEEKDADADERFDLAEARLDAERAAGLTAGENAFVVPSETKPFVPLYGSKFAENSAFLNDEADYDGSSTNSLNIDGPFMGGEDTRITRMKVLADKISSGELTPTALEFAKKDLARLSAAVERTGGQDTIEKYFSNQIIGPALRGAEKYGVKGIDFAVNNLGLGSLASQAVSPEFAGLISDYTSKNAKLADDMRVAAVTSPAEMQSNAILDAMITNDVQTKAGSATNVDNSLGALITDGKAQIEAVPGPLLTPKLNDKLAAELETVVQDRKKEISEDGALINKMWGESKFQPKTDVKSQIVNAEGLTAAEQLDADRVAGLIAGEDAFVANTKQDAGGGGKNKPTGIATVNPMANRASDSPSSYEQKLLDILAEREKSADQDKWLGLAEMGMRLMASSNPNLLSAIGEAGLGASQTFLGNIRKDEEQEMDILTKLSALESRKQIADDANRTRLEAARISRSGRSPVGMVTNKTRLSETAKQIKAVQASLDGYRGSNLSSTQAQEKSKLEDQLKILNAEYTSLYNNQGSILGTALAEANTPVAVDLR